MNNKYNCKDCKDTGWYGDNGPGIKGNSEYHRCECGIRYFSIKPTDEVFIYSDILDEYIFEKVIKNIKYKFRQGQGITGFPYYYKYINKDLKISRVYHQRPAYIKRPLSKNHYLKIKLDKNTTYKIEKTRNV